MTVGEKIKKARITKGITQKELGQKLGGLSQQQIGQWETGNVNPKWETIVKIAFALDVGVDEIIDIDNYATDEVNALAFISGFKRGLKKKKEEELLEHYRKLNAIGEEEAIKRVSELTEIERYTAKDTQGEEYAMNTISKAVQDGHIKIVKKGEE